MMLQKPTKKIQNKDSKFISCMIVKRAEKTFLKENLFRSNA